jgi:hypothetical protein
MSVTGRPLGSVAVVLACLGAAIALQVVRDRQYPERLNPDRELLYVRSGPALERLALSFDASVADLYWIRAVQYFGGQRLAERKTRRFDLLYPLLDITTTLDPYFNIAYRFGAIFVAEGYPDGPGRPDLAVRLLRKGVAKQPHRWQYLYDIAFVHYWWLKDYKSASYWFQRASQVPNSPEWMRGLAAITLAQGRDRVGSRFLWQQIYDTAEHQYMRRTAEHRLQQLDAMDQVDQLNALVDRVRIASGRPVTSWEPLARSRVLRQLPPLDPAGVPYVIDPQTGRVTVSRDSPFHPLPDDSSAPGGTPRPAP